MPSWSPEEVELLERGVLANKTWHQISQEIYAVFGVHRKPEACRIRHHRNRRPKGEWGGDQLAILRRLLVLPEAQQLKKNYYLGLKNLGGAALRNMTWQQIEDQIAEIRNFASESTSPTNSLRDNAQQSEQPMIEGAGRLIELRQDRSHSGMGMAGIVPLRPPQPPSPRSQDIYEPSGQLRSIHSDVDATMSGHVTSASHTSSSASSESPQLATTTHGTNPSYMPPIQQGLAMTDPAHLSYPDSQYIYEFGSSHLSHSPPSIHQHRQPSSHPALHPSYQGLHRNRSISHPIYGGDTTSGQPLPSRRYSQTWTQQRAEARAYNMPDLIPTDNDRDDCSHTQATQLPFPGSLESQYPHSVSHPHTPPAASHPSMYTSQSSSLAPGMQPFSMSVRYHPFAEHNSQTSGHTPPHPDAYTLAVPPEGSRGTDISGFGSFSAPSFPLHSSRDR